MNVAAIAAISSAVLALFVALLTWRISVAPGARDQRGFWVVALSAALYALCDTAEMVYEPAWVIVALSRVQLVAAMAQLWGWIRYSHAFTDLPSSRYEAIATFGLPLAAVAALVPGVAFTGGVSEHPGVLGGTLRHSDLTPFGTLLVAALVAGCTPILRRFVRAWRAGVPYAGLLAVSVAFLFACAVNDALAVAGILHSHDLLAIGFSVPVVAVGWVITGRFVAANQSLERLRADLEATVEARSHELATALDALHQAEKLAAVGQFASGVAHEVNSPASVVTANLRYLVRAHEAGAPPEDAHEVAQDALHAMKRINDLVRKLVDAGRLATFQGTPTPISVAEVVGRAVDGVRSGLDPRIALSVDAPEQLSVRARADSLEEVLANLLANAADAIPQGRPGRVAVRAERVAAGVRISVADDGVGMGPEVLRCAFDPFFTTKPAGRGVGLGLAVARALVESHSGSIRLESLPGAGTTAIVELPHTPTGYLPAAPPRA
jgi:signal transduction histidine kinase